MSKNQAVREILRMLYEGYRQNPNSMFDIEPLCTQHELSATEMSKELIALNLIKAEVIYKDPKSVFCSVTIFGVYQVDSAYVEELTTNILGELNHNNGSGNIVEYLNTSRFHYKLAIDLANYLQKLDYVTIELINIDLNYIRCDLCEEGKNEWDRRQAEKQMKNFQNQQL